MIIDRIEPARAKTFAEARGTVINDYQAMLEKQWLAQLRQTYPVKVNEEEIQKASEVIRAVLTRTIRVLAVQYAVFPFLKLLKTQTTTVLCVSLKHEKSNQQCACLILVGWFLTAPTFGQGQGISLNKIIAKVDNYYVLRSDLEEAYQSYVGQNQTAPAKMPVAGKPGYQQNDAGQSRN